MASRAGGRVTGRGDATPISGGISNPSRFLVDLPQPETLANDELGQQIALLMALHPEIELRFRGVDFVALDVVAKQQLLDDIRRRLDIRPFRKPSL